MSHAGGTRRPTRMSGSKRSASACDATRVMAAVNERSMLVGGSATTNSNAARSPCGVGSRAAPPRSRASSTRSARFCSRSDIWMTVAPVSLTQVESWHASTGTATWWWRSRCWSGSWDHLSAVDLASVCAVLVYESRGKDDGRTARLPAGPAGEAIDRLLRNWERLKTLETEFGVRTLPDPDLGLAWPMLRWAQGRSLDSVLWESDMTAGDFVRWTKQVIDLLGQVIQAGGDAPVDSRPGLPRT